MSGWVRLECGLQYELPVVWDTGREWLKYQVVLIATIVSITWLTSDMYAIIVHDFDMTYLIHVTVPVILSAILFTVILLTCYCSCSCYCIAIMLLIDFATILDTYGGILFMHLYIYSIFCISLLCTTPYCSYIILAICMFILHISTCMFTSITSPLDNIITNMTRW